MNNHPAPREGTGLECDKLSKAALDAHWAGFMQKILDDTVELSQLAPAPAPDDLTVFPFLLLSLCRAEEDGSLARGRPRLGRNKG